MDQLLLWKVLVGIRILSVLVPQSGYIHPDEFFQSTEVVAGDVLDVQHQRTWEFTWSDPIRSVVLPYLMYAPILYLIKLLNIACPQLVLAAPRIAITAASLIVDRCVFWLCRKHNNNGFTSLILYATSYVSWVYMTHTFSNTIETILFVILLAETSDAYDTHTKYSRLRRPEQPSTIKTVVLASLVTVGTFNRPTFLIFAFVPMVLWFWKVVMTEYKVSDQVAVFVNQISLFSMISVAVSLVFIVLDSLYYRFAVIKNLPADFKGCVLGDSKIECFGKMVTNYRPSIVIAPVNFLSYNLKSSNLAEHGTHAWFTHAVISLPLLFGPAVVFVLWRVLKNILNIILGGSLKVNTDYHLDDVRLVAMFSFPLVVLSCISHQEPRFLLPLVPLGFIIATKSLSAFKPQWLTSTTYIKFWVFNILAFLVYGFFHQGGIVPGISKLQEKVKGIKGESHVVFYHTYMAPEHLFLHPEDSDARLNVYNLGGASFEKLEKTMDKIRTSAETKSSEEWSGIWIVAPKTVVADIKQLKVKYGKVNRYFHLSCEDPPRFIQWLKGEVSTSDLFGDFNLVVAEVDSWKVFDSSSSKKKGSS